MDASWSVSGDRICGGLPPELRNSRSGGVGGDLVVSVPMTTGVSRCPLGGGTQLSLSICIVRHEMAPPPQVGPRQHGDGSPEVFSESSDAIMLL